MEKLSAAFSLPSPSVMTLMASSRCILAMWLPICRRVMENRSSRWKRMAS